jgi:dihydrofolate synthase/folylpolyglutamate synthase
VIPGHVVALTSLDLEHTNLLGNTLEQIAYDKADLCPDGGTLVIGHIDADVLRRLKAYCELRHITPIAFDEMCHLHSTEFGDNAMIIDIEIEGTRFRDLESAARPSRVSNAAVAVLLTRQWLKRHYPQLPGAVHRGVYTGLAWPKTPARFKKSLIRYFHRCRPFARTPSTVW